MRPEQLACGGPVHPIHHPGAVAGRRLLATVRQGRGTKKKCEELARPDRKCMLRPPLGRRQLFAPPRKKCEELDSRQACDLLAQGFAIPLFFSNALSRKRLEIARSYFYNSPVWAIVISASASATSNGRASSFGS